jgi:hypothetical protein
MKRRRRILTVAGLLVIIALIDFVLLMSVGSDEPNLMSLWRLVLTGVLSVFLALGKNSARWVTVVLTALGAFGGFMITAILLVSGNIPEGSGLLIAWVVVVTVAYGAISAFLAFSSGVTREIRRIAERIEFPESRRSHRRVTRTDSSGDSDHAAKRDR